MLDHLHFYCRVLCNGMKMRFRMVMIAHPGPGIGFHKQFMWRIIIPPTPARERISWIPVAVRTRMHGKCPLNGFSARKEGLIADPNWLSKRSKGTPFRYHCPG